MGGDLFFLIKLNVAIILFFVTVLSTFLPHLIRKQYGSKYSIALFMSFCNCLAGGTVLGVMLMHVFPSIIHTPNFFNDGSFYPLVAMFSCGCSFLLLFAIDRLFTFQFPSHIHADSKDIEIQSPPHTNVVQFNTRAHTSKTSALAMILALSLHSFLEGLGLGPISSKTELVSYIIGLVSHKWLEAFALGVNILGAGFSIRISFYLILFYSVLTPLGICIGMSIFLTNLSFLSNTLMLCIVNGLSIGSFLFVCCVEMIPPEFAVIDKYTHKKFLLLCGGFLFMTCMALMD